MAYPRSQLFSDQEPGFYHALRRSALAFMRALNVPIARMANWKDG